MALRPPHRPIPQATYERVKYERSLRRVHRSRGGGPIFSTIGFFLLGLNWIAFGTLGIIYLRPRPLGTSDYLMWAFCAAICLFYFWIAYAVYHRRSYIWNIAIACAGICVAAFPTGTLISVLLITNLFSAREKFVR